jgi:RNA polymerase sigma-70 factor (ECF subfamily)
MDFTRLLRRVEQGDSDAERELIPLVYSELKRLAGYHLKSKQDVALNTTALVHEAYLRMAVSPPPRFEDRAHFFGIASRVMRNVLVDFSRSAQAGKRSAAFTVSLEEVGDLGQEREHILIEMDDALNRLAVKHPRSAKSIEMRYFGGMTIDETCAALCISSATAERDLRFAHAWLRRELSTPNT